MVPGGDDGRVPAGGKVSGGRVSVVMVRHALVAKAKLR
jgi:hypothetical protein